MPNLIRDLYTSEKHNNLNIELQSIDQRFGDIYDMEDLYNLYNKVIDLGPSEESIQLIQDVQEIVDRWEE